MTGERIGILTFHEADNQGAVLQAYALQTFLTMSGKKAEIINYSCAEVMRTKHAKKSDGRLKYILMTAYYRMKGLKFDSFRKKRLALSKPYDSGNITYACNKYNAIIAGSDQIWNLECSGNDYAYFLDFADLWEKNPKDLIERSLIIFNTEKGCSLKDELSAFMTLSEALTDTISLPNLSKASIKPSGYDEFWRIYKAGGFMAAQKYAGNNTLKGRLRSLCITAVYKIGLRKLKSIGRRTK